MKSKWLLLIAACVLAVPLTARAATRFDAMDTDQDGYLSYDEVQAAFPGVSQDTFATMDADGDGLLTHAEWADSRGLLGLGQGWGQGQGKGKGKF